MQLVTQTIINIRLGCSCDQLWQYYVIIWNSYNILQLFWMYIGSTSYSLRKKLLSLVIIKILGKEQGRITVIARTKYNSRNSKSFKIVLLKGLLVCVGAAAPTIFQKDWFCTHRKERLLNPRFSQFTFKVTLLSFFEHFQKSAPTVLKS